MHLFKSLQTPEPQFHDDMLFWRDGMMGNWTFPRNSAPYTQERTKPVNTILTYLDRMTNMILCCSDYTTQYRLQNYWHFLMCRNSPPTVIYHQYFSCFHRLSTNIRSLEQHQLFPIQLTPTIRGTHVIISRNSKQQISFYKKKIYKKSKDVRWCKYVISLAC